MRAAGNGYRVSRNRSGQYRWWRPDECIPADHCGVRPATEEEAAIMRRVCVADRQGRAAIALRRELFALLYSQPWPRGR